MPEYIQAASGFVQGAKAVSSAVDILKAALAGGEPADISFASEMVSSAADVYAGMSRTYGKFGFDQLAAPPVERLVAPERAASDLLASALVDLHVANTLMTAGQAAGEGRQRASIDQLEDAAGQLNVLTSLVALPMGKSADTPLRAARFGFDTVPTPSAVTASPTPDAAKAAYEKQVGDVCTDLVVQTKKVLQAAHKGLQSLDASQVVQAINSLGEGAVSLPDVGKLISKGLQMALRALEKINQVLKSATVKTLREQAGKLLEQLTGSGGLLDGFLNYTYQISKAKDRVKALLAATKSDKDKIDIATGRLAELQTRFAEQMTVLDKIVSVLGVGKTAAGFFLPQAASTALFGVFYLLIMNYAVLAGMDYADAAGELNFVEGLINISVASLA